MSYEGLGKAIMRMLEGHRGRARAIPRQAIEDELGPFVPYQDLDRSFRKTYAKLPICSSASKPAGLFIPLTSQEIVDFLREYSAQVGPIHAARRRALLYQAYPHLVPVNENQMELFG